MSYYLAFAMIAVQVFVPTVARNFDSPFSLSDTGEEGNGIILSGEEVSDYFGYSVSGAGDVNGDGISDIIIGARLVDNGATDSGSAYVLFGGNDVVSGSWRVDKLMDGSEGFEIRGKNAYDYCGKSVSGAGDVNGDGYDDIMIGCNGANANGYFNHGETYIVFGGSNVGSSGLFDLRDIDGSNGFVVRGVDSNDYSGYAVSDAGDINGDNIKDMIIGAVYAESTSSTVSTGETYVVYGSSTIGNSGIFSLSDLDGSNGFIIYGIDEYDYSGVELSSAGDVNGDGYDDVLIGASGADAPGGISAAGECYVIFGGPNVSSTGTFSLTSLDGSNGFVMYGVSENAYTGFAVSDAGDFNNDGVGDIIVAGHNADTTTGGENSGESYIIFGNETLGSSGELYLSELNGKNGFKVSGLSSQDHSGVSVSNAGDVNGDQISDIIIGAYWADGYDKAYSGESYIIFGGNQTGASGSFDLNSIDGKNGVDIYGFKSLYSGTDVSGIGDFNNDSFADVIIGAPFYKSGRVFILLDCCNTNSTQHRNYKGIGDTTLITTLVLVGFALMLLCGWGLIVYTSRSGRQDCLSLLPNQSTEANRSVEMTSPIPVAASSRRVDAQQFIQTVSAQPVTAEPMQATAVVVVSSNSYQEQSAPGEPILTATAIAVVSEEA